MKKNITENIPYKTYEGFDVEFDFDDRKIDDIIKDLQELKRKCQEAGYSQITLSVWSYEGIHADVKGTRPETPKEEQRRLKRAQLAKEMREKKKLRKALQKSERKLYEELKAKYEPQEKD